MRRRSFIGFVFGLFLAPAPPQITIVVRGPLDFESKRRIAEWVREATG